MTVMFEVPHVPVGQNQAYRRSKQGRMFMTAAARSYKDAVRAYAIVALREAGWPKLSEVRAVEVEIEPFNSRIRDADSCVKLSLDALEGVAYLNDSMVVKQTGHKPKKEGGRIPGVLITLRTRSASP